MIINEPNPSILDMTLSEIYLDYFNNYLSTELFAEHKQIPEDVAKLLIAIARGIYNQKIQ